ERLREMGLAGSGLPREAEAQLEVGGHGLASALHLAMEPVAHRGLEARALLGPEGGEARRALPHERVQVYVRDLLEPPACVRGVAQGKLAAIALLAQEVLRHFVEEAATLEGIETAALLRLLRRLQPQDALEQVLEAATGEDGQAAGRDGPGRGDGIELARDLRRELGGDPVARREGDEAVVGRELARPAGARAQVRLFEEGGAGGDGQRGFAAARAHPPSVALGAVEREVERRVVERVLADDAGEVGRAQRAPLAGG